jgi:psp operon transcriptional activator
MPSSTRDIPHVEVQEALGESSSFLDFQERISRVAAVDRPVLFIGERGTGKELAVSKLHYLSGRWERPLVALNCAALAPSLVESELFGHEAGAFTGATGRRQGRFESADGGTLFLDEIAVIPIPVQEKLLRVVEYGTFERVGGSDPVNVNVRIIGATNANLKEKARQGAFMFDLLDRLSFDVLYVPPLRFRKEDILLLGRHFTSRFVSELGWEAPPEFTKEAEDLLVEHPWPGNIRELKNVVERAVYRSDGKRIAHVDFDPFRSPYILPPEMYEQDSKDQPLSKDELSPAANSSFEEAVQAYEVRLLKDALEKTRFHQRRAADRLGLSYHQFRGLYRKHSAELIQGEKQP